MCIRDNSRFYLPFISRPWRRHELQASLMALLKTVLEGTHPMRHFTLASLAATALTLGLLVASPSMAQTAQPAAKADKMAPAPKAPAAESKMAPAAKPDPVSYTHLRAHETRHD